MVRSTLLPYHLSKLTITTGVLVKCTACEKTFSTPGALHYHARTCRSSKKRVGGALEKVREAWKTNKRRRLTHADVPATPLAAVPPAAVPPVIPPIAAVHPPAIAPGRPQRTREVPKRFNDFVPHVALPSLQIYVPTVEDVLGAPNGSPNLNLTTSDGDTPSPDPPHGPCEVFRTPRNAFGLSRTYLSISGPTHDPDSHITLLDLVELEEVPDKLPLLPSTTQRSPFHPYPNKNSFSLGKWYWNHGTQKSQQDFKVLIDIVGAPDFDPSDIQAAPWTAINQALGSNYFDSEDDQWEWEFEDAGWYRTHVTLDVPFHKRMKNPGTRPHVIGDLYHRSIMSVIKEKLANPVDVNHLHYEPYELSWTPSPGFEEVRVHGELFTSPAFIGAHREIQSLPSEPGCTLPRCVMSLMIWSDATHLTAFGSSKLWPAYLYMGNESKYRRCKPSLHLANHIAYFQTLPDSFKDFASEHIGGKGAPTPAFMAHCRRELFHTQWSIILDEEFIEAWMHGIVIMCLDGILRRFYPRIITYSADYPEKALVSSIRNGGRFPCPRCLVTKEHLGRMGMKFDMQQRTATIRLNDADHVKKVTAVRRIIYEDNFANAFHQSLGALGFNPFQMLVVDILHEWEVGTWKAILIHLIRLVYETKGNNVALLDARYRQIPTFGKDTIRKFTSNTSELKRLGARDFADLLQCAIPAFEGLLPEPHNSRLMELLFVCATWHGLAKLRLHTDITLKVLDDTTLHLGYSLREFVTRTCSQFNTRELPREAAARSRQAASAQKHQKNKPARTGTLLRGVSTTVPAPTPAPPPAPRTRSPSITDQCTASPPDQTAGAGSAQSLISTASGATTRRPKTLNLNTYKFHSLGDVADTIRHYGTTDSYSTEIGELEHRTVKARYKRTDRKAYSRQIARIERREARLRKIHACTNPFERADDDTVRKGNPDVHHIIGKTENLPLHIGTFVADQSGDPAIIEFIPKLKHHLLPRIRELVSGSLYGTDNVPTPTHSLDLWHYVHLKHDRLYKHNIMRVNYTTYDIRRGEDIIHVNTSHCNVMVLNPFFNKDNGQHPFWFVDRDMVMRYHWGLAVGHVYSHATCPSAASHTHGLHQTEDDQHLPDDPVRLDLDQLLSTLHTIEDLDREVEENEDGFDDDVQDEEDFNDSFSDEEDRIDDLSEYCNLS
ncbi:hypothetical protein DXG01_003988 [Tephrocybe rancida]|nr:hypothetical protein DXG01_003988 [Tephrocybe rancida]